MGFEPFARRNSAASAMIGAQSMHQFPSFMKSGANRIASAAQHTADVEGYVFDGADGTQVAFWECRADANTEEHIHEFDEYFLVVEGCYTVTMDGKSTQVSAGQECVIPRGTRISGSVVAGTRTIHMFGGRRATRDAESQGR
jgi:quercetin dioxygenase-like cupin family protein